MVSKAWIKFIVYQTGKTQIEGDCDMCKQFPCMHTHVYWNIEEAKKEFPLVVPKDVDSIQQAIMAWEREIKIRTGRFGYASLGKAKCMGEKEGFLMIMVDDETDDILGASCIGVAAPELIAEIALAMNNGLKIHEITDTIHSHPTLSEMVLEAAEDVDGLSIHRARRRIKQKIDLKEDMIQQFVKSEKLKKYGLIKLKTPA